MLGRRIRTSLVLALALATFASVSSAQDPETITFLVEPGLRQGNLEYGAFRILFSGPPSAATEAVGSCVPSIVGASCEAILFSPWTGQAHDVSRITVWTVGGDGYTPFFAYRPPLGTRIESFTYQGNCGTSGKTWDKYRASVVHLPGPPQTPPPDADLDGLCDGDEELLGTDPHVADTDGDGLLDGTEFELSVAEGWGTADPLNPDTDGDLLLDGEEVMTLGTSPGKADTDGDLIPDAYDYRPLLPDLVGSYVEEAARALALEIATLDPSYFAGSNINARQGRRNGLANALQAAANEVKNGQTQPARSHLASVLERIDGSDKPEDWMIVCAPAALIRSHVELLISLTGSP